MAASLLSSSVLSPVLAPQRAMAVAVLVSAALLAGAWWFQLVLGLEPCTLCLQQRWPHYAALATGLTGLAAAALRPRLAASVMPAALAALTVMFAISVAMGAYHSGVEWKWWPGPADCAAAPAPAAGSTAEFLAQLQSVRVVNCAEAPWRWLGLSLAGWNTIASLGLASFAGLAWWRSRKATAQGSSSLSQ